jgi:Na+-translocating ferredoxin:NAD+ oxidoreductase subunit B
MQPLSHDAMATHTDATANNQHSNLDDILIERIDAILPQTQCQQCGYAGCKPYATAIVQGSANINQCPPGGEAGIHALSVLLNVPDLPLNTAHGFTKPKAVAVIDEQRCIGCTLCIKACPVDAILGASKHMHTVISQECTGCELCLAPCPVDCITMQPLTKQHAETEKATAPLARRRYQNRQARLEREIETRAQGLAKRNQSMVVATDPSVNESMSASTNNDAIKKSAIAAAMARVKALKSIL